jgi:hypothetical protein
VETPDGASRSEAEQVIPVPDRRGSAGPAGPAGARVIHREGGDGSLTRCPAYPGGTERPGA